MKTYKIESKQNLPISIDKAWEFFSDPKNLAKITPPSLNFVITSDVPEKMYQGMIITYKVHPFLGIPFNWITEITHVNKPFFFVDVQRSGPYKLWHHQHIFNKIDDGVEMIDIVHYTLPFGIIGSLVNFLAVKNKIHDIFEYRRKTLKNLFGEM